MYHLDEEGEDTSASLLEKQPTTPASKLDLLHSILQRLCRFGRYVTEESVPSFIRRQQHGEAQALVITKQQSLALDGLRGFAAFAVYNFHFLYRHNEDIVYESYGQGDSNTWLIQLPFIRLLYAGAAMVNVFFAISGYALSIGLLRSRRDKSMESMLSSLVSSTFRRGIRLYLPSFFASFLLMVAISMGLLEFSRPFSVPDIFPGQREIIPDRLPSFTEQFMHWKETVVSALTNIWSWGVQYPAYDPHLWTIRTEFQGSITLYLTILAVGKVRTLPRLLLQFMLILYCLTWGRWELCLFLSGMFVAETDILRRVDKISIKTTPWNRQFQCLCYANFAVGLYLLSMPIRNADSTPGYIWLDNHIPSTTSERRFGFWYSIGALQVLWSAVNCPTIAVLFTNPISHYLGKISYSLYVLHGPIIWIIGYVIAGNYIQFFGRESMPSWLFGILIEYVAVTIVLIWLSDIFYRHVDVKSVAFAKWVEGRLFLPATAA